MDSCLVAGGISEIDVAEDVALVEFAALKGASVGSDWESSESH